MPSPLVSVLVPCYNAAPWLEETLRSALAQTHPNIEIILVDDGSTDGSADIASGIVSEKIKIIRQANSGQSAALNLALRNARGEFIQYLDADDVLAPDKIERQLALLSSIEPGWIASGEWARFTRKITEARFEPEPIWHDFSPVEWLVTSWRGGGMMHGAAWLLPRSIVDQAGPWSEDLTLANDFDYFCYVLLKSRGVKFCPGARTYYRSGLPGRVSGQKSRKAWQSAFRAFSRGSEALLAAENSERTRTAAAIIFQGFAHTAYPVARDLVEQAEQRVRELGGCNLKLRSGHLFNLIASLLGWKAARWLQYRLHQISKPGVST